jgi:phosphotransferase system enzyme I (PtsI)
MPAIVNANSSETTLRGIPVSGGVCRGRIVVVGQAPQEVPRRDIAAAAVPAEITRLEEALVETRRQLLEVQRHVGNGLGMKEAAIFDAHLLALEDPVLVGEVTRTITEENVGAEYAFQAVAKKYIEALSRVTDDYLRERATDIRDVAERVLDQLLGRRTKLDLQALTEPCIVVAHDLSPSVTAQMNKEVVLGFATDLGGPTSHTAIMARSLGIPAVVGLHDISQRLRSGDEVLLDGYTGAIILHPSSQTQANYGQVIRRKATLAESFREVTGLPARTLDGHEVLLSANIENAADMEAVTASGARGVGLFRTEYLFIDREHLPSEADQLAEYQAVAAACHPDSVVIRTLDLGGDKFLTHFQLSPEVNPSLGARAIRFCLEQKDLFRTQLRAILRASARGNVKLMYPMVSGIEEVERARELVEECKAQLRAAGQPFDENLDIGAMVETPSAAIIADLLGRRLKFFSIGSNDLIQYTLAADRTNDRVAHLYEPTHPAIVRLIKATVDAAHANGLWAGVCGEMAGEPALIPLLLGLGVDELSTAPSLVPPIKFLIRHLKVADAAGMAREALQLDSGAAILARTTALARAAAPSLFEEPGFTANSQTHPNT